VHKTKKLVQAAPPPPTTTNQKKPFSMSVFRYLVFRPLVAKIIGDF
jgi:hypothetical protein